jgi:hypothetical protein
MAMTKLWLGLAAVACASGPIWLTAGQPRPETQREFECYVQSAEARMDARKAFLLADSDSALNQQLISEKRIATIAVNGANPHKLAGGHLYDWMGVVFIPGAKLDKLVRMLQDYDHRAAYFPETIATSKLLCRTNTDRFTYRMRMKEPAVIDVESDVVWERVDGHRWRCRSYSTKTQEVGKDHGYLRQLYSYWRFAETEQGVYVEAETITLSDEFGGMSRAFGSMLLGINPEKSLKHSLAAMRESVLKPNLDVPALPEGLGACGTPATRPGGCSTPPSH